MFMAVVLAPAVNTALALGGTLVSAGATALSIYFSSKAIEESLQIPSDKPYLKATLSCDAPYSKVYQAVKDRIGLNACNPDPITDLHTLIQIRSDISSMISEEDLYKFYYNNPNWKNELALNGKDLWGAFSASCRRDGIENCRDLLFEAQDEVDDVIHRETLRHDITQKRYAAVENVVKAFLSIGISTFCNCFRPRR